MPESLMRTTGLLVGLCVCVLLWGASIAGAYWDLKRRRLPTPEVAAWLALVALLPGVGLLAYLFARALNRWLPLPPAAAGPGALRKRFTLLRPTPAAAPRTGTIAASELVKATLLERRHVQPAPSILAQLMVTAGPHAGQEFQVRALPARLGRGAGVALPLDRDRGVSREHAELYQEAGALHIRDLLSQHGTAVNGVRVEDRTLQTGDSIELGYSVLIVKLVEP
jgi:hypothetical protein